MGQDRAVQDVKSVRAGYAFAWTGTRYCDLNMSEMNLTLIKEGLADGHAKDAFIAITAHLVHKTSRLILLSEDIPVEEPLSWEEAARVVRRWYTRKTDEIANPEGEQTITIEVEVKE